MEPGNEATAEWSLGMRLLQSGAWLLQSGMRLLNCTVCSSPAVALQQRYCVFQLLVPDEARFAIELR